MISGRKNAEVSVFPIKNLMDLKIRKTSSGCEVDFILGDHEIAIEAESAEGIKTRHLKGLRAFREEFAVNQAIAVSLDPQARKTDDGTLILPWKDFLRRLWAGEII